MEGHERKEEVIEIKLPKITQGLRKNPWIISTLVFGILSAIFIINNVFFGSYSGSVSPEQAGEKLAAFLNENSEVEVSVKSTSVQNGLYKIEFDYQGNVIPIYTTMDGNFFIQDLIPLDSNSTNNGNTDLESSTASVDDDAVLGNKNAPITIIEFSDYQCPFCRKFWGETLGQLKKDYIDTGKVKLVFRDFPLSSLHPMAQASAEAAECVREKGGDAAYFKFHDKMFEEQNIIDSGSATGAVTKTAVYTNDDLKAWAKETGYDIASCLDSGKYKNEVLKDVSDAQAAGFQGTPGFLIMKSGESSGTPLKGAYPIDSFKQIIDGLSA